MDVGAIQVHSVLESAEAETMLTDPDFATATDEIPTTLTRVEIEELRQQKSAAMKALVARYECILLL